MASPALTDDDRRELLRIARTTLREMARMGEIPPGKPHRESLLVPSAAFVVLRRGETLRGAAGRFDAEQPLYRAVQLMTVAAAFRDPRAGGVDSDEEAELAIAIALLAPGAPRIDIALTEEGVCFPDDGELARLEADRFDERSHPPRPRRRSSAPQPPG